MRFMQTYCRSPKGVGWGEPLRLASWQRSFLRAALADGVSAAVMSLPRGNGKSTLAAALALWALFDGDDESGSPQVPIVAVTVGQAIRSVYGVAVSMVAAEPALAERSIIYSGIATPRIYTPANEGTAFPIASDVAGLQGLDPTFAIADEVGFLSAESFHALQLAGGKRPRSLLMGLGTPGLDRDNALYQLRRLVADGATLPGFVYREHSAPPGSDVHDERVWRRANPALRAGYLRIEALRSDLAIAPESHFRIFRLGEHDVQGADGWLGADGYAVWAGLEARGEDRYELAPGAPTWVGMDVGLKRDSTAVVAVQYRADGRLHAVCRIWLPSTYEPVDVTDVMGHLRDLARRYHVEAIAFDPRFFDVPAKMLADEKLPMIEVPQSPEHMTPAIGNLYAAIMAGTLSHDHDEAFTTQILNAVPRLNERGFTLAKGKSRGRIDAAVALALAVDRAQHRTAPRPKVVVL